MKHHDHKHNVGDHERGHKKVKVGGQHPDTTGTHLAGANVPKAKMFKKAKKAKGAKGKHKGMVKGKKAHHKKARLRKEKRMLRRKRLRIAARKKHHVAGKKRHHAAHHGKKHRLAGGMMRWYKNKAVGKKKIKGKGWHLVKKADGNCLCTQHKRGRLSVRKFTTQNECENNRHGC